MRSALRRTSSVALSLALVMGGAAGLSACGDDDGADVREIGDTGGSGSGSGSGSASGVESETETETDAGSSSGPASTGEETTTTTTAAP